MASSTTQKNAASAKTMKLCNVTNGLIKPKNNDTQIDYVSGADLALSGYPQNI